MYQNLNVINRSCTCQFQDFENEESFTPTDVAPSGPAGDFSLYPPVENTPDTGIGGPIIFEPLPDIPGKRSKVRKFLLRSPSKLCLSPNELEFRWPYHSCCLRFVLQVSNASALRPKVSTGTSGRDRVDSEESLEDIIERDSMQDKLKLQNLLSK